MAPKKFSAYMIFVTEWQNRTGERNLEKAVKLAAREWDRLSEEEKNVYKEEAKARNAGARGRPLDIVPSFTTTSVYGKQDNKTYKEKVFDTEARAAMVERFCSMPIRDLIYTDIYVMSFNVAVKTKQNVYIPIEIGIVKFSLAEGIKDAHHEFIDGGRTPIGHGFEVKEHMDRVHRIPLYDISEYPVSEMAATNSQEEHLESVEASIAAIRDFVRADRIIADDRHPERNPIEFIPVFTLPDLDGLGLVQTDGCLKRMAQEVNKIEFYEDYIVLDLTYLLFCLYKRVSKVTRPLALCIDDFHRAIHSYEPNTNCEFHDTTDTPHCALSRSYRFSYVLLDVLMPIYQIEATPAHRPKPGNRVAECELSPMEPFYQEQADRREVRARTKGTYWSDK